VGLFGRRDDPRDGTLTFFSEADAARFRALVVSEFARRGVEVVAEPGRVRAQGGVTFGLVDLAAKCRAAGRRAVWRTVITEHVEVALRAVAKPHPVQNATQSDLEEHARLRLWDAGRMDAVERARYGYAAEVVPGVLELLVYDDEFSVLPLTDDVLQGYDLVGVRAAALHNLLLEPVDERDLLTQGVRGPGDGTRVHVLFGQSYYVASKALVLRHVLSTIHGDREYPHGVLVAAPGRHLLYLHVVESPRVVPSLETMTYLARLRYREEPGALSPDVYWWDGGGLWPVTAGGAVRIQLGSGFHAALEAVTRVQD
jgi:hypothetical protein